MGHSLGGLLCELQASHSGLTLWDHFANRPIDGLRMSDADREMLRQWYFFEPHPFVSRVICVATPHRGSRTRNRLAGRLANYFVRIPEANVVTERVVKTNPGAFKASATELLATSDGVLGEEDRLSTALRALPRDPRVPVHSIIGSGEKLSDGADSDGVVTVASARLANVASERLVTAGHAVVHRHPAAIAEVKRILREHAAVTSATSGKPLAPAR
jgi:hypothetical protein